MVSPKQPAQKRSAQKSPGSLNERLHGAFLWMRFTYLKDQRHLNDTGQFPNTPFIYLQMMRRSVKYRVLKF